MIWPQPYHILCTPGQPYIGRKLIHNSLGEVGSRVEEEVAIFDKWMPSALVNRIEDGRAQTPAD